MVNRSIGWLPVDWFVWLGIYKVIHALLFLQRLLYYLMGFIGLGSKTNFGVFRTDWIDFGRDLRVSKTRVSDVGRFLLVPCVTSSFAADPSPFLFVKDSGVSFYHFLFSSLLYRRLLWLPNENPQLPGHKASTQQSCLRRRHEEIRILTPPCLVA